MSGLDSSWWSVSVAWLIFNKPTTDSPPRWVPIVCLLTLNTHVSGCSLARLGALGFWWETLLNCFTCSGVETATRSFVYAMMLTSCTDEVCTDPVVLHQSLNFYCAFYSKIPFKVVNKSVFVLWQMHFMGRCKKLPESKDRWSFYFFSGSAYSPRVSVTCRRA